VGVLCGIASAVFLAALDWVTQTRLVNQWLILLLPLAGAFIGWAYQHYGSTAKRGTHLILEQLHHGHAPIPRRMTVFILLGTLISHLFGGSVGREGTAVQMGASLADGLRRLLRLQSDERRLILMAGISGGFGSVFGVPAAGFVFGMEVQSAGHIRYEGIIPCLVASVVGDLVTRALGIAHAHLPALPVRSAEPLALVQVVLAAVAFGLASLLFIEVLHAVQRVLRRVTTNPVLQPFIGGCVTIALTLLVGTTAYNGLSTPLISASLDGTGVVAFAWLLKLIFTTITLGSGFVGGEVTPLFVIGATLGYALGGVLGIEPSFLAALGMVAVFGAASNTPLACAIMGIELFGGGAALYFFIACAVAYLVSGQRSIYHSSLPMIDL
jgi:H+/Cl- antiporter ClcA